MKTCLVTILTLLCFTAYAQTSGDVKLDKRLQEYMDFNRELNYVKLVDYLHPKLFTIAPKDAVLKSFEESFKEDDEVKIRFDDLKIESISASFKHQNIDYRKIEYYMDMALTFTDSSAASDEVFIDIMKESFATIFPGKKITFNKNKLTLNVSGTEIMFALKDPKQTDWMFLGYKKESEAFLKMLYPAEVIKHFKIL